MFMTHCVTNASIETMASHTQRPRTARANGRAPTHPTARPSRRNPAPSNGAAARAPAPDAPDKPSEIFAAALRLFQAKGYHGASMQDLADAVGMQKASLYYYFRSKQELLTLVCERGAGAFTQTLEEIVASDLTAPVKLRRAMECHLVALCEQLDLFSVFLREQKFLDETQKEALRGEGKKHAALWAAILEQGIASGEFRAVNVTVTTLALLGMCNWLYEWYSPDGAFAPREIAATFSELILTGLTPEKSKIKKGYK